MPDDCIFCQIVAGEIPSHTVYEDDHVFAFLDVNPLAPGHTLVIPKAHHERLNDLPEDTADALYAALHDLVPAAEAAVDAPASNVGFNNGEESGQEVPHVHGHVIPRFADDGGSPIHAVGGAAPDLADDELADIAADIAAAHD
ncbi:histidine triad (HIT) family protein [Halorientalis persicus]|jgi:histidine triad (HIT) family protein|uniref:Histidine triad (HIT) family protein n=1 Tax=Halorientalis persicus TaxID=1367881 RepID=A0A1H8GT33_9EURY|nr:HIT family protein [Halorientalis persicus]SEN47281.1 histidine triad (HIT) family protein [Halorientalis persicus]